MHKSTSEFLTESRTCRDTAWDLRLGAEAHDADHRRAAVKDLGLEAAGLRLGTLLREPVERVVQVELDLATNAALDGRVVARLAALGVVDL